MKKQLRLLCLGLLVGMFLPAGAQNGAQNNVYLIYGGFFNEITNAPIKGAKAILMTADSVDVDSMQLDSARVDNRYPAYRFYMPKKMPHYIVRIEAKGHETCYVDWPAHEFKNRTNFKLLKDAYTVRRMERNLDEVAVTATKVKFYMKNDTVVFNADAFQLTEGSMLDALIRQLPGVELKDNGEILVNGRKVESLLLNGEDFFRGNNRIMLENLPSYTVKNVQVYEKAGDLGEMAGHSVGDELYVMDVKLKKEYSIGWMGNIEGGYSTEDHYLARLFAMRYTPQSRITLIGNVNNVNDSRKPGQNSDWTPNSLPSGKLITHMAGLDYHVNDKWQRYELTGNVLAQHSDAENTTRTASEDFLPGGSTFGRSESFSKSHSVSVSTDHYFRYVPREGLLYMLAPRFSFSKTRSSGTSADATFNEMPGDYDLAAIIDSIRSNPRPGGLLRQLAVNRTLTERKSDGRSLSAGAFFGINKTIADIDFLLFRANVSGSDSRRNSFNHYQLDYPVTPDQAVDFRNRWNKGRPNRALNYSVGASYQIWVRQYFKIEPGYTFSQSFRHQDNLLYRLDRLDGWGEGTDHALGTLPSEADELLRALDTDNSTERQQRSSTHTGKLDLLYNINLNDNDRAFKAAATFTVNYEHQWLDYAQGTYDGVTTRNFALYHALFDLEYKWHEKHRAVFMRYTYDQYSPDMVQLLDITDNADPLNIRYGNPNLKKSGTHYIQLNHTRNTPEKQRSSGYYVYWYKHQNLRAQGYVYDRQTGVRYYRPENVNGNQRVDALIYGTTPLDKQRRLTLTSHSRVGFYHGVDLISSESGTAPTPSSTNTWWANQTLRLDYRFGKVSAGIKAYAGWNRATSKREDFVPFNVWDYNYGPTVQVELPWDMQLSTDLMVYSRRGYADPAANTDDVVWNARLAKRFLKGNLSVMVDGFDILGQLSNLTQTINSQGRFETWRDVTPRYVMFHAIYRLHILPKTKAQ